MRNSEDITRDIEQLQKQAQPYLGKKDKASVQFVKLLFEQMLELRKEMVELRKVDAQLETQNTIALQAKVHVDEAKARIPDYSHIWYYLPKLAEAPFHLETPTEQIGLASSVGTAAGMCGRYFYRAYRLQKAHTTTDEFVKNGIMTSHEFTTDQVQRAAENAKAFKMRGVASLVAFPVAYMAWRFAVFRSKQSNAQGRSQD